MMILQNKIYLNLLLDLHHLCRQKVVDMPYHHHPVLREGRPNGAVVVVHVLQTFLQSDMPNHQQGIDQISIDTSTNTRAKQPLKLKKNTSYIIL